MSGRAYLVGAGPGDAGLLTRRGEELLRSADVVIHDRLVGDDVLDLIPAGVEVIDVGKHVGRHSVPQERINGLIVEHALAGRRVVRLKGGDPYIFGRGWEELRACEEAGVGVEVVPGVTSAIGGPAAAGIPVTARGAARSVTIITARAGEEFVDDAGPDYGALAKLDTLVVMMGRGAVGEFARSLIAAGRDADTPAAIVENATLAEQWRVTATLGTIAEAADAHDIGSPSVVVIGPTAAYRPVGGGSLVHAKPLAGRRFIITRPRLAGADAARRLRELGAQVIESPLIRIEYIDAPYPIPQGGSGRYDWLVVTSLHGVRGLARSLELAGLDTRALAGTKIAAVGPKTAAELYDVLRLRADLVPGEHRATALVAALGEHVRPHHRVVFPHGTLARDEVAEGLRKIGASVHELRVYDTLAERPTPGVVSRVARWNTEGGVDAVLLYSPSGARSLAESGLEIGEAAVVCVGPTTAAAVRQAGLAERAEPLVPASYGDDGVIAALVERFARQEVGA